MIAFYSVETCVLASSSRRVISRRTLCAQSNFTDPESQIMKTSSEGFQQCYNAQTAPAAGPRQYPRQGTAAENSNGGHVVAASTAPRNPPRFPKPSGSTHPPLPQQEKRVSK